jgi:subtilisin family serine protease
MNFFFERRLLAAIAFVVVAGAAEAQVLESLLAPGEPRAVPGELIVQFKPEAGAPDRNRIYARLGVVEREHIYTRSMMAAGHRGVVLMKIGMPLTQALDEMRRDPAVEFVEPNWIYTTSSTSNDPYYTNGSLWGMYSGNTVSPTNQFGSWASKAWFSGNTGSQNVYVGVIDEGIDFSHIDLAPNAWTNSHDPVDGVDNDGNGYRDDTRGWDFVNNDNTVYDGGNGDKHGTHVAGTIGARGGNGTGVAGVCWNVTIISAKFLGRNGGTTANAIKAVDYFTDLKTRQGLNIVATNNSWGGGGYSQALADAITRAQAADILFIAAAGNGGSDGRGDDNDRFPHYPASYPHSNVIAVASITSSGALSGFSNFGATSVDLGAPGSGINSTLPRNSYGSYSGTSMATPHVTGGAALYKTRFPSATWSDIKTAIMHSALPTPSLTGKCVSGGRLHVGGF